jgi:L-malate glycosyltransferase
MKQVRVLLIAPTLDIVGGQAVQADRLLRGMLREPSVKMGFLPINPRAPGILSRLQRIKYVRTAVTFCVFFTRLAASVPRYDVLHIFTAAYYSYLLWTVPSILIARLFGKKTIVNYRDGQCEDHLRNWRTALPTLRLADEIVAPSGFLVDVFKRFGLRARSIFNIIDLDQFAYRKRQPLRPVFMTNRGLEPLYNVGCILRGFQLIQRRRPEATLTVAHDGPCRKDLEALTRELDLRNVSFIGSVSQKDAPKLYDAADIYLTTPNIDNMPASLLECFASGVPAISTRVGGVPYILDDERTGLLIAVNDHVALAEAALRLLDQPDLAGRITFNARAGCDQYRWQVVRDQWIDLYRQLNDR